MFFLHVSVASQIFFSSSTGRLKEEDYTPFIIVSLQEALSWNFSLSSSGLDLRELWSSSHASRTILFYHAPMNIYQIIPMCFGILKKHIWITSFTGKLSLISFKSIEVWIKILYPKELISCPRLRFCSIAIWPQPEVPQSHLVITWSWVKILAKQYPKS